MTSQKVSFKDTITIGLMLFALFFGAGNLIFPPALGQSAGSNLWSAVSGFLITGVGLPLLGVLAIGLSGSDDAQALAKRVHPIFAVILMASINLTIGPLFAIPRTGAVAYEIGIRPFLSESINASGVGLLVYTLIFFGVTYWLSLNPSKMVDRIGKLLTPALLIVLALLVAQVFISPLGTLQIPNGAYMTSPFAKGFQEGYLTMDTLASFVFGIIVINAIRDKGVVSNKEIAKVCTQAGIIAAGCLAVIYVVLSYLGATSVTAIGKAANGGIILAAVANYYYGALGNVILGIAITFACLTTSIGLVCSCAAFFTKLFPHYSYKQLVLGFTLFSAVVANFGLTHLIVFSVPVLVVLYPLVIVLILLSFLQPLFSGRAEVYGGSLLLTGVISVADGLKAANISLGAIEQILSSHLPFFDISFGWLVPAIVGGIIGYIVSMFRAEPSYAEN